MGCDAMNRRYTSFRARLVLCAASMDDALKHAQEALAAAERRLAAARGASAALARAAPVALPPWTQQSWLAELLTAEQAARTSAEMQARYRAAEASGDPQHGWLEETDALQRRLLRARGVSALDEAAALRAVRAASYTFPELASIPLYRRFQRARRGTLAPGDAAPDVPLLSLDGATSTLSLALLQL